jgi:ribosomal protein S18 acetylase RimI-like enzyme
MQNFRDDIIIQLVDQNHKADINLVNEPFDIVGRFLPSYENKKWSHDISYFEKPNQMCFPDENYDFDKLSKNSVILGAYTDHKCVGIAILQNYWYKYMYLCDLKVSKAYRNSHVGSMLMEKAKEVAKSRNYKGIYTRAQDNNLGACLFYLKSGFAIGGIDTNVYKGTSQDGKIDILFYSK